MKQVGHILELFAKHGDSLQYSNALITPFHSHYAPNISIELYLCVLSQNAGLTDEQAPCLLILLERLCQASAKKGHPIYINSLTVHRLVLTVVLVASKILNDLYYTNSFIASIGGISLDNINKLEQFFLIVLDWNLHITTEEFDFFSNSIKTHSDRRK